MLTASGVTDIEQYSISPGTPLMADFFLDEKHLDSPYLEQDVSVGKKEEENRSAAAVLFDRIRPLLNSALVQDVDGTFLFLIQGEESSSWLLNLKTGEGSVEPADSEAKCDVTMSMKEEDFAGMFSGKLSPTAAFMGGKLKISGNMMLALKFEKIIKLQRSKL